jgi:hypothetical protein
VGYSDIKTQLEQIKSDTEFELCSENFLDLEQVDKLLKRAVNDSKVKLTNLVVKPENGSLEGDVQNVKVLGTGFGTVNLKLQFKEVDSKVQAEMEIQTTDPADDMVSILIGRFVFAELRYIYDFIADEGKEVSVSGKPYGKVEISKKKIPVQMMYDLASKQIQLDIGGKDTEPVCLDTLESLTAFVGKIDASILPVPASKFYLKTLSLTYSSDGKVTKFSLELTLDETFKLLDVFEASKLSFGVTMKDEKTAYKLTGVLKLASIDLEIDLEADYDDNKDEWTMVGSTGAEPPISLTDLVCAVTGKDDAVKLPDFWLTNLKIEINLREQEYDVTGTVTVKKPQSGSIGIEEEGGNGECAAKLRLQHRKEQNCLGIRLDETFKFSNLPLVGNVVTELDKVSVGGLTFFYSDKPVTDYTMDGIVEKLTVQDGLVFLMELTLPDEQLKFCVPLSAQEGGKQALAADSITYKFQASVPVNKAIGPFEFQKLLFTYEQESVGLGICAAFVTGEISLSLDNLIFTYDIEQSKISTALDGLSLKAAASGFSMEGGFVCAEKEKESYSGSVQVKVGNYGLALYGAYEAKPYPSAFLFGMLNGKLAGAPCFLVTGIAAGFGYSRTLLVPSIESLEDFPLLAVVTGKRSVQDLIAKADETFPATSGANWVAAGIVGNSFQMVNLTVLAMALLNQGFSLDLIGRADVAIPKGAKEPVAEAGLLIKITVDPESGVIPVEGILTEGSYVLSKDCHISGGFAFYMWYGGQHAGDFVISLGGYRNGYEKPEHYPAPSRLKLSWKLSSELNVEGSLYFAMTPSCLMAGGDLQMVFEWKCVYAWFHAYTDILMGWKPYTYAIDIGISLGVKVNLKLYKVSLELGCDLSIWGPDFSGIAQVHLWIISFSISFGKCKQRPDDTISADEFCQSFLPEPEQKKQSAAAAASGAYGGLQVQFTGGIINERKVSAQGVEENSVKVVNAQQLMLEIKSQVPWTTFQFNGQTNSFGIPEETEEIWIRPCNIKETSQLVVKLQRKDETAMRAEWEQKVIVEKLPSALWADRAYTGETISCCTGVSLNVAKNGEYRSRVCTRECKEDQKEENLPAPKQLPSKSYDQTEAYDTVEKIGSKDIDTKRKQFLGENSDWVKEIELSEFKMLRTIFCVAPVLSTIGGE